MLDNKISETLAKIEWLINLKKYEVAKKMALELITFQPNVCNTYGCLAIIYIEQKELEKAETTLGQRILYLKMQLFRFRTHPKALDLQR